MESVSLLHRLPVAAASQGCHWHRCPSSSLGGHRLCNNPSCGSRGPRHTSRCDNDYKWLSCARGSQEASEKSKRKVEESWGSRHTPLRLLQPNFSHQLTSRAMSPLECGQFPCPFLPQNLGALARVDVSPALAFHAAKLSPPHSYTSRCPTPEDIYSSKTHHVHLHLHSIPRW
ncbi:hypothetical protein BC827DRAFT_412052 [Russula dissimulans]|nr:hypothetical protein BC827DRAFT_412052 [Russula dissimulans]